MTAQQLLCVLCIFLCIGLHQIESMASNSLADCQIVASAFRSTINYTATNITATTGVNVTCSAPNVVCPGQNISGVCVWQRKLSAVCRNASGTIKIRIQTNNLPPRCASVPMGTFVEVDVDFEVNFNPDVSINSLNSNLNTLSVLSQTLCTLTSASTVPSASGFVNYGSNIDTATGVSVDGVVMFTPDSANNVDPFYPPAGFPTESVDSCLAHCQSAGIYHYHIATGCMLNPPTGSITACAALSNCSSNISAYSIAQFANYQTMTVIGVAKDGHVVYGPYLSSGTRVTSGFDVCNGMFYDSIGNYAYFATSTYPYMAGCFGPGNYPSFGPNCTTNGVSSYTMSSYATSFLSNSSNSTNSSTSTTMASTAMANTTMASTAMANTTMASTAMANTTMASTTMANTTMANTTMANTTMRATATSTSASSQLDLNVVLFLSYIMFFICLTFNHH